MLVTPVWGGRVWGFLTSHSSIIGELQANERPCIKGGIFLKMTLKAVLWYVAHTHTHTPI